MEKLYFSKKSYNRYYFNKINILIQHTYNPIIFSKCIQSILAQTHINYRVLICYDDERCREYLDAYKNHPTIELFKVKEDQPFKKVYYNYLLSKVKEGWVMFLSEDGMLAQPDTLKQINNNIQSVHDILFWKVQLGKQIVFPNIYDIQYGQIQYGQIDTMGFCFHAKYKNAASWFPQLGSDLKYVTTLLSHKFLTRRILPEILTQSVMIDEVGANIMNSPDIFHKYELKLTQPNNEIKYIIVRHDNFNHSKLCAHLHCYDIDRFEEIYGEYINRIKEHFNIIITYSVGTNIPNNYTILKIPNKGMDIGAKFCMVHFLQSKDISYSHILFLHSKSNLDRRKQYFELLIDNLEEIIREKDEYDGYFPDREWEIEGEVSQNKQGEKIKEVNNIYRNELLDYLKLENKTNRFIEGNCYILSKKVIDKLFTDLKLYNILNKSTDFDYNYVKNKYQEQGTITELYNKYGKINIETGENSGIIEHSFERIVLNCCEK